MDLLLSDKASPLRWGKGHTRCFFRRDKARVTKSYDAARCIKGRDTSRSRWAESRSEEVDRIVLDMSCRPSPPSSGARQRPETSRFNSDSSGTSSQSSASSRNNPATHQQQLDQGELSSPMRKLLLTMPPMGDGHTELGSARRVHPSGPKVQFYTWGNLPSHSVAEICVRGCYQGFGMTRLLCPIDQVESEQILRDVYDYNAWVESAEYRHTPHSSDMNRRLCQLLLLAALGSHELENESIPVSVPAVLFTSGKWYLDMLFGRDANDLQRLRATMLVALNLLVEKRIGAVEYLNRAMTIGLARGLHRPEPPTGLFNTKAPANVIGQLHYAASPTRTTDLDELHRHWTYWRRTWRSLIFLDGWISASLGSIPQMCKTYEPISENNGHPGLLNAAVGQDSRPHVYAGGRPSDLDDDLYLQLGALGVLMSSVTNDVVAPDVVELATVRYYSERLKSWHAGLPAGLTLTTALKENCEVLRKNSILLIHCAYLGSITQLTRRLLVDAVTAQLAGASNLVGNLGSSIRRGNEQTLAEANATAEDFSRMCVDAARQLATVIGMLRLDNRPTKRCWLIIQSAYTAAIVICLDLARHRGRPMLESAFNEYLVLISKCLNTLQHCASFDTVPRGYFEVLLPIYRTITTPEHGSAAKRVKMYSSQAIYPSNEDMLDHLLELLKAPFGGEATVIDPDCFTMHGSGGGNLPEHYRFLNNAPQQSRFQSNGIQTQQHSPQWIGTGQFSSHQSPTRRPTSASPTSGYRDIRSSGMTDDGNGPFRSKKEYEAFFNRVT